MTQTHFDFGLPPTAAPAPTPKSTGGRGKRTPSPPVMSLEDMARRLEQDANYRVLRRLVPITDYGPAPTGPEAAQGTRGAMNVLVLDTETTGLSHQADKIIELAMLLVQVDVASGMPFGTVDAFEGFEDPGMPIPATAREVTGISDDMVQGHRLDDQLVAAMVARADLIVAHNAGFDRPFVEARFPCFAEKAWACSFADIDWRAAGAGSSKLGALALDQGWFYDAHRALVDCHALLQVLARPVGQGDTTGLQQLMGAASRQSFKLRATGAPFEAKDQLKGRGYRWDAEAKVWFCTLADQESLEAELAWLKANVYGQRSARVVVEGLDSRVRYSARAGNVAQQAL